MKKTVRKIGKGFKKLIKVVFRVVVFLVLLFIFAFAAAALMVQYLVSEEALKTIIAAQLQDVFNRPVQIQDVKFNVYQGIRVQGFQVIESPEFGGGSFMTSDYLLAKYKWKALLHKRLEFEQIQVIAPRIQLLRRQDGRWNWEDILASLGTHPKSQVSQVSLPVDLFAHVISIEHGIVAVKDLRKDHQYGFQGFNLTVEDFDIDKPFSLTSSFEHVQDFWDRPVHSKVFLKGSVSLAGLHLDQALLQADDLQIQSGGKTMKGTLSLKDFHQPKIDTILRLPKLDSTFFRQYHPVVSDITFPASRWRARFSFPEENKFQLDSLTGTAGSMKFQANGTLGISKISKPFHVKWTFPAISLQETAGLVGSLEQYKLSGTVSGNGELVGDFEDLDHTLAVEKVEVNVHDFGGLFHKNNRVAHVDGRLSGTHNFDTLLVAVDRGSLTTYGSAFSGINFLANIRKGDLEFQRLNAVWDISHFQLRGLIKRLSAPREIHMEGTIDKMRLDAAIDAFLKLLAVIRASHPSRPSRALRLWSQIFKYSIPKSFPAISGHVQVGQVTYPNFETSNLDARWELRGISTGLKQANGNIRVGFGPGRVADIPALENQDPNNILRGIFLPFVFMHRMNNLSVVSASTAYPKSMDFSRIYGDYGLKRGVVNVRLFRVDSTELLASADGQVDFPKEKVDLHILERLTHARGALPEYMSDEQGRPSLSFFVLDDLNHPTYKVEPRKMSSDAIEKAINAGLERGRKIFSGIRGVL